MKETVATITWRPYVSMWTIALEFCRVDFNGFEANKYSNMWRKTEFENWDAGLAKEQLAKKALEDFKAEQAAWRKEHPIKAFFCMLPEHLNEKAQWRMEYNLRKAKDSKWKDVYELKRDAQEMLSKNGFSIVSSHSSGGDSPTETFIYKKKSKITDHEE